MRKALLLFFTLVVLMGCDPIKRSQRLVKRAERLNPAMFQDTTLIRTRIDTIWMEIHPVVYFDTLIKNDTVFIYDTIQDVKIQYFYDTLTNTIRLKADCPDCPEITITEDYLQRINTGDHWKEDLREITYGLAAGIIVSFFVLAWRQRRNKKNLSK
jgi:hypothetical protein